MQAIKQELATQTRQIENLLALPRLPKTLLEKLPSEERRMLEVKYQSKPFGSMTPEDLDLWADAAVLKIHAITGWVVPEDTLMTVFADQLRKKMVESYATVNPDELEYAFRQSGTTVKDWGKAMNLSLIDEVMIPYLGRRAELSKIEEQKAPVQQLDTPQESLEDQSMEDWLQDVREKIKVGKTQVDFMPLMLYDYVTRTGQLNLTNAQKQECLVKAVDYRLAQLAAAAECSLLGTAAEDMRQFAAMKEAGEITGAHIQIVKNLAKRIALYDYCSE